MTTTNKPLFDECTDLLTRSNVVFQSKANDDNTFSIRIESTDGVPHRFTEYINHVFDAYEKKLAEETLKLQLP
jgi:hypothetical protein